MVQFPGLGTKIDGSFEYAPVPYWIVVLIMVLDAWFLAGVSLLVHLANFCGTLRPSVQYAILFFGLARIWQFVWFQSIVATTNLYARMFVRS